MKAKPVGSELRVNTYVAGDQNNPAIATSGSGNYVIAWNSEDQDGEGEGIFARLYAANGTPFAPEFRVNTTTEDDQELPDVAMAPNGDFMVVWTNDSGGDRSVYAQQYTANGQPIGSEFRVNSSVDGDHENASVAMSADGSSVVVWAANQQNDGTFGVDESGTGIFAQRYSSRGTPLGQQFRVNTTTTNNQDNPAIAIANNGNFVVVWESNGQDTSGTGLFGQRYDVNGNPIGIEFQVNSYVRQDQRNPAIASDSAGNFVVAWESENQDGNGSGIYAKRYAANGNPLGQAFRVNSDTEGDQISPTVSIDNQGNFTIAWASENGGDNGDDDGYGVFAQQYTRSGSKIGEQFQVNRSTESDQDNPAIGVQPNGNFLISWETEYSDDGDDDDDNGSGDGNGEGVFAQRYQIGASAEPNEIRGDNNDNKLTGTSGDDKIFGLNGDDTLLGQSGNDVLIGAKGEDVLKGVQGNDTLRGEAGRDELRGQAGSDFLYGGGAQDTLIGGAGVDVFAIGPSAGREEINDFTDGVDRFQLLDNLQFGNLTLSQLGSDALIQVGTTSIALVKNTNIANLTAVDFAPL